MAASLEEIEAMVDALAPEDQLRLVQHILPRLNQAAPAVDARMAWEAFRRVGERLAATSGAGAESITDAVSAMRR